MVQATETATLEQSADNFDTSTDELVLRVCSPARRGQIVRLRSHKCTIGSARSCTLRLNARGVQPVHCLIMRGANAAVIRCWTPDTRINGRSFSDANLNLGDRLTIGPIEFEVLDTGTSHVQTDSQPGFQNEALAQTASQLDEDRAGLIADKEFWQRERESQTAELDQQRRKWESERDAQQQQLSQAKKDLDSKTAELQNLQETLRLEREQIDAHTEALRQDREQLDTRTEALRQERGEFETQAKSIRQEHGEFEAQAETIKRDREELEAQAETIRQEREQLEAQAETMRQEREQLEAQAETIRQEREQFETQSETIKQKHKQLEAQAETLRREREEWEAGRGGEQSESAEENSLLEQRQRELESKREEFERQVEQWQEERNSAQQQLQQNSEEIESKTAELEKQRENLQREREQWDAERSETEQRLRQHSEDIDQREASLLDQQMQLEEARSALESGQEEELNRVEVTPPAEDVSPEEEPSQEKITSEAPVNLNDILERLGAKPTDEDQTQSESQELVDESPASEVQQPPEEAVRLDSFEDEEHNNDEESLDSYMARLMDRVRSVSGSAAEAAGISKPSHPKPAKKASVAPGVSTPQATAEQAVGQPQPIQEKLKDLSPRGVAPERGMSLSNMRELANVSAQTAIDRHAKRQFRHAARSKLLVASIGLVTGGILMYMWWFMGDRGPIFYAGLLAFLVALFWGFQFAIMSGKVSASRGNIERLTNLMSQEKDQSESDDQAAKNDSSDSAG